MSLRWKCALPIVLSSIPLARAAAAPFLAVWSTDPTASTFGQLPATYGPDGPWSVVVVGAGNSSNGFYFSDMENGAALRPSIQPFYPCDCGITSVLFKDHGGTYSSNDSTTAYLYQNGTSNTPDDSFAQYSLNSSASGYATSEMLTVGQSNQPLVSSPSNFFTSQSPVFAAALGWNYTLPNGKSYTPQVGTLGLGRLTDDGPHAVQGGADDPLRKSLLQQMKDTGVIPSVSFGLQIGSVPVNTSGSLVFGGYDVAKLVGPVGSFWYVNGFPAAILKDINLGVVQGGSPFGTDDLLHLYAGNNGSADAERIRSIYGAPTNSTIVVPNAASPYITLPAGNCENIAKRLPVTLREDIGYYVWNTNDPQYSKIVSSPAYLEFLLGDTTGAEISIKVPFKNLNLTLESPIVDTPIPYFPCRSAIANNSQGVWMLGRAFLQSAFLGVNYEQNITWIAQAPGRDTVQSVLESIQPGDKTVKSSDISVFADSWKSQWTPLPGEPPISSSSAGPNGGLIAGAVIGTVLGVALIAIVIWYYCTRRRHNPWLQHFRRPLAHEKDASQPGIADGPGPHEFHSPHRVAETGEPLAHETDGKEKRRRFELGIGSLKKPYAAELPTSPY